LTKSFGKGEAGQTCVGFMRKTSHLVNKLLNRVLAEGEGKECKAGAQSQEKVTRSSSLRGVTKETAGFSGGKFLVVARSGRVYHIRQARQERKGLGSRLGVEFTGESTKLPTGRVGGGVGRGKGWG